MYPDFTPTHFLAKRDAKYELFRLAAPPSSSAAPPAGALVPAPFSPPPVAASAAEILPNPSAGRLRWPTLLATTRGRKGAAAGPAP